MPYYCTVPRCTSMAGKAKNVSFHQFPRDEGLAELWNTILKRGKPYTKYSKVCSLHFKPEDYTMTSVGKNKGQWRTLRKDAIPSRNLPSDSPTPHRRRSSQGDTIAPALSPILQKLQIQQQLANAMFMQTFLAMQAANCLDEQSSSTNCNEDNGNNCSQEVSDENQTASQSSANDSVKDESMIQPHKLTNTLPDNLLSFGKSNTSYKCFACSKCFKDPDVFMIHKRSHRENTTEKENYNKENLEYLRQETLRSNPILANLLTPLDMTEYPGDIRLAIEATARDNNLIMAFAANMTECIRKYSTILNTSETSPNNNSENKNSENMNSELESDNQELNDSTDSNNVMVDV